jgi:beta-glucanase (GH16 family)
MTRILVILSMVVIYLSLNSCGNNEDEEENPGEKEYVLTWSDEFDGETIDASKWDKPEYNRRQNTEGPDGWWLKEDSYLDGNGNLVIRARKIDNRNDDNDLYDYSTGAIRSKGKFQQKFGKFEIRCQFPTEAGWWVAFWLMSNGVANVDNSGEDGTEIDIFEGFGWTDKLNFALH